MDYQRMFKKGVLVLDRDLSWRRFCKSALKRSGMKVDAGQDFNRYRARLHSGKYSLVIVSAYLLDYDKLSGPKAVKTTCPTCEIIVTVNSPCERSLRDSFRLGASDYLEKNYDEDDLLAGLTPSSVR